MTGAQPWKRLPPPTTAPVVCEWCGDAFTPTNRKGPTPKYCRPSHRQRAYQHRHGMYNQTAATTVDIDVIRQALYVAADTRLVDICNALGLSTREAGNIRDRWTELHDELRTTG